MNILNQAITGSFRQRLGITVAISVFISVQLLFALLLILNELPLHLLPQLFGWSILMACCCWLLTWLSARRLILPLLALGETITQIQRGENLAIPQLSGRDEIAKLSRQFAELMTSWNRQQDELKTFNLILEEMIEERMVAVETIIDILTALKRR